MALLRNLEQSLSGLVEGTVGRVFRTEVRPTEIARKLAREMEINKRVSLSRTYAPTDYIVYLSPEDRARYAGVEPSVAEELGAYLLEHARRERLVLVRRPLVEFRTDQRLRLGEFGIEARTAPISAEEAPPRAEPQPEPPRQERRPPVQAVQPDPIGTPAEAHEPADAIEADGIYDDAYEDPYAHDAFAGAGYDQPEDYVEHEPEGPVPHGADWLDPVDDWDPDGPEPEQHAAPAPPAAPVPTPDPPQIPGANAPMTTPWIDPTLRASSPPQIPGAYPPAQPAPRTPTLRLVVDGQLVELFGDHAIIGRSRKSDVVVSDPSVSRQHVELRRDDQGWYAVDLGSTNGSSVDGAPLTTPRRLGPGARIEVGHASAVIEVR
ncbi:MAG: DUF3662 domain-containing protein [Patulibacter minatonensis]